MRPLKFPPSPPSPLKRLPKRNAFTNASAAPNRRGLQHHDNTNELKRRHLRRPSLASDNRTCVRFSDAAQAAYIFHLRFLRRRAAGFRRVFLFRLIRERENMSGGLIRRKKGGIMFIKSPRSPRLRRLFIINRRQVGSVSRSYRRIC